MARHRRPAQHLPPCPVPCHYAFAHHHRLGQERMVHRHRRPVSPKDGS